jgi:hypothetical protein
LVESGKGALKAEPRVFEMLIRKPERAFLVVKARQEDGIAFAQTRKALLRGIGASCPM